MDVRTLADEIARLLFEHGESGGWVRCAPAVYADDGWHASVTVIEAGEQRSFVIAVQEKE